MADTYESLPEAYNNQLQRTGNLNVQMQPSAMGGGGTVEKVPVKNEGAMDDVWIKNTIRSTNWKAKTVGFYIDGRTGYAEFANLRITQTISGLTLNGTTITGSTITGGTLTGSILTMGGAGDSNGYISVLNSSGVETTRINNEGIIVRNKKALNFQESGGGYSRMSITDGTGEFIWILPETSNSLFIQDNSDPAVSLFTIGPTDGVYAGKNGYLLGAGFSLLGNPINAGFTLIPMSYPHTSLDTYLTIGAGVTTAEQSCVYATAGGAATKYAGANLGDFGTATYSVLATVEGETATDGDNVTVKTYSHTVSGFKWKATNAGANSSNVRIRFLVTGI